MTGSRYIKGSVQGSLGGRYELTISELTLYFALVIHLAIAVFYPVYSGLIGSFPLLLGICSVVFVFEIGICEVDLLETVSVIAFLLFSMLSITINHSGMGVLIQFIWPLVLILFFRHAELTDRHTIRISLLMLITWIIGIASTARYTDAYFRGFHSNGFLPEGINPNTAAFIITVTCFFITIWSERTQYSIPTKVFLYTLTAFAVYHTRSRSSLIAFVIVVLTEIFLKKKISHSKAIAIILAISIVLIGTAFPFVYVNVYQDKTVETDVEIMGKNVFSGREDIWIHVQNYLRANKSAYLWGIGYNTDLYSRGSFNLHNAYLQLFAQYGALVLILYMIYILYLISKWFGTRRCISDQQFACYKVVLFILIVSVSETILSYTPFLIYLSMALGIGCRMAGEVQSHDP